MKLAVIGLGKLGLCTAAFLASRGFSVMGVDNNRVVIDKLSSGINPIDEPGLDQLLTAAKDRLSVGNDIAKAVARADVTLIIVPTPSKPDGSFSNESVLEALQAVGSGLAEKNNYHVVDVVSTVMPGSGEQEFIPLLEHTSGKTCGPDFGFVYNPEFIALGTVIRDFSKPDMVLIGASDERASEAVASIYRGACLNSPPICSMSLINAEITKLALNCFVTMKISFANELARICEKTPGADVDVVSAAIGRDTRIGKQYLKGGLGFGGPCFPRDNKAFTVFAHALGYVAKLSPATQQVNQQVVDVLRKTIKQHVPGGGHIALIGMAYKAGSPIVEASQSLDLALCLLEDGYRLTVSDPRALDSVKPILMDRVDYQRDPYRACEGVDGVALLTPWPIHMDMNWRQVDQSTARGAFFLDCWRIAATHTFMNVRYHALGLGRPKTL